MIFPYISLIIDPRDPGPSPLTLNLTSRSFQGQMFGFPYISIIIDPRDPGPSPLTFVTFDLEFDLKVISRSNGFFLYLPYY